MPSNQVVVGNEQRQHGSFIALESSVAFSGANCIVDALHDVIVANWTLDASTKDQLGRIDGLALAIVYKVGLESGFVRGHCIGCYRLDGLVGLVAAGHSSQFPEQRLSTLVVLFLAQDRAEQITGIRVKSGEQKFQLPVNLDVQFIDVYVTTKRWLESFGHVFAKQFFIAFEVIEDRSRHNFDFVCLFQCRTDSTQADVSAMHRQNQRYDSGVTLQSSKSVMLLAELPAAILAPHYLFDNALATLTVVDDRRRLAIGTESNFFWRSLLYLTLNIRNNLSLKLKVVIESNAMLAVTYDMVTVGKIFTRARVRFAQLAYLIESIARLRGNLPDVF